MSKKLKLYQPVNLGGEIGFLPKGEVALGKGEGEINPVVLNHWLVKAMINDGKAAIIIEPEAAPETPKKPQAPETPKKPQAPETDKSEAAGNVS
jgi:hypothetical protein